MQSTQIDIEDRVSRKEASTENLAVCNFCGSSEFVPGPRGRLSKDNMPPRCKRCGSLERHRALRQLYLALKNICSLDQYSCLQISNDVSVKEEWFGEYELSVYGGENSIDLQQIERPDNNYRLVVCNHVLEHVEDDVKALSELIRIFREDGFLELSVPSPATRKKTQDWGYPKEDMFGHYRTYGIDIEDKFKRVLDHHMCYLKVTILDPVTKKKDMCFLFFKSKEFASSLIESLSNEFKIQYVDS